MTYATKTFSLWVLYERKLSYRRKKRARVHINRPRRSRSAAAYSHQTFPWTICRSVCRSVRSSVCPVHCGETADRIRMPFSIIGRTGPGMRQVVGFGDRSTGRGTFGGEFGARHCPQGPIGRTCVTGPRRGPLAKLLWEDSFRNIVAHQNRQEIVVLLYEEWP